MEESLQYESENAVHIISSESIEGAQKFALQGLGRHGKFNVTQVPKEEWEIEREQMMKEAANNVNENDKEKMGWNIFEIFFGSLKFKQKIQICSLVMGSQSDANKVFVS